jgi:hypothetical protein
VAIAFRAYLQAFLNEFIGRPSRFTPILEMAARHVVEAA